MEFIDINNRRVKVCKYLHSTHQRLKIPPPSPPPPPSATESSHVTGDATPAKKLKRRNAALYTPGPD